MKGLVCNGPFTSRCSKIPLLMTVDTVPSSVPSIRVPASTRWRGIQGLISRRCSLRAQASNVSIGSGGYEGRDENEGSDVIANSLSSGSSSAIDKPRNQLPYPLSIALVLSVCALVYLLIVFGKAGPSSLLAAVAKSGFTAAFTLIFVSEIGDKTFFIAALLAMQYEKVLVLLGSMGALSLMTVLSVVIGRIFQFHSASQILSRLSGSHFAWYFLLNGEIVQCLQLLRSVQHSLLGVSQVEPLVVTCSRHP